MPNSSASACRRSVQVTRFLNAPCSVPSSRLGPAFSSKPFSSIKAVNSVEALPSFSRTWPRPRPSAVSKVNQPSPLSISKVDGPRTSASRAFSIAAIAPRGPRRSRCSQVEGDEIAPVARLDRNAERPHRRRRVRGLQRSSPAIVPVRSPAFRVSAQRPTPLQRDRTARPLEPPSLNLLPCLAHPESPSPRLPCWPSPATRCSAAWRCGTRRSTRRASPRSASPRALSSWR